LAAGIRIPVMIIHGEKDQRFPLSFALQLKESFPTDRVDMFIAQDADHSDSSHTPGYREAIRSFLDKYGSA
jgi:dipeptidyl aminopeptidase/acylaminoacyl peptidase